ncbi:ribose-phosphate diphosphokinase [Fodinibius sediminis]|uniref:ribose-phosphate diphosphokinase n=1 Tax=Fodinibius sediminis TaxID=1214077 RepID=A0A521BQR9_9BACT|nr:ribose-phosphate pyrophosphokinase [Fodinibius sediminis]SMO49101.1 ribose-phosphate pyrophosphokinase [Fodinibius sediminis]
MDILIPGSRGVGYTVTSMAKTMSNLRLFTLNASSDFGNRIARHMGIALTPHEERDFEDGEHKIRTLESVRNCDVYVIHALYADDSQSVNDKLCRMLFFIGSLKDAGAQTVTAVVPYLCYMRKDRKTKPRDPVTSRYVGSLFKAAGTDRILTIDVHNLQAYQNGFRCYTEHLEAQKIFTDFFAAMAGHEDIAVMSPDSGGVKRAEQLRRRLEREIQQSIPLIFLEKKRSKGIVSGETVVGKVKGKTVVIIDDLISSGTTLARAAQACVQLKATRVYAAATHGAFIGQAAGVLEEEALSQVVITNTIPPFRLPDAIKEQKVKVLDVAPLFAEAISRMHEGGSLVELMDPIDN